MNKKGLSTYMTGLIIVVIALLLALNYIAMWLWNNIMVNAVTFANKLGYWEFMGFIVLIYLLLPKISNINKIKG